MDGVLGGFPETSEPDLRESRRPRPRRALHGRRFLNLVSKRPGAARRRVLDCGAGIGRAQELSQWN